MVENYNYQTKIFQNDPKSNVSLVFFRMKMKGSQCYVKMIGPYLVL